MFVSKVLSTCDEKMEPCPDDIRENIQFYATTYQTKELLSILLSKLLLHQPLDPYTFLIDTLNNDTSIQEFLTKVDYERLDLRRTKTKKKLLRNVYKYLLALQNREMDHTEKEKMNLLKIPYLFSQLKLIETREYLYHYFPKHTLSLILWYQMNLRTMSTINQDDFIHASMRVLNQKATN